MLLLLHRVVYNNKLFIEYTVVVFFHFTTSSQRESVTKLYVYVNNKITYCSLNVIDKLFIDSHY